jgi:hypothetical protein
MHYGDTNYCTSPLILRSARLGTPWRISNDHTTVSKISGKNESDYPRPSPFPGGKGLNYRYICHSMAPVPHPSDATMTSMIVPVWAPDDGPCGMPGKGSKGLCPSSAYVHIGPFITVSAAEPRRQQGS